MNSIRTFFIQFIQEAEFAISHRLGFVGTIMATGSLDRPYGIPTRSPFLTVAGILENWAFSFATVVEMKNPVRAEEAIAWSDGRVDGSTEAVGSGARWRRGSAGASRAPPSWRSPASNRALSRSARFPAARPAPRRSRSP